MIELSLLVWRLGHHLRGIAKLELNTEVIDRDIDNCWEVLAEPIQTVMRRHGIEKPYEQLKELTRGKPIDEESLRASISHLGTPDEAKQAPLEMPPSRSTGPALGSAERRQHARAPDKRHPQF